MSSQQPLCPECLKLQKNTGIDIEQFLQKLTVIKQKYLIHIKSLSPKEIEYICLSLSGYTKGEIAFYFYIKRTIPSKNDLSKWHDMSQKKKYLNSEMSSTVHKYVNEFMGVDRSVRFLGWEEVIRFLQNNGHDRSYSQNIQIRKISRIDALTEFEQDIDDIEILLKKLQQIRQQMPQLKTIRISLS
jgi:hypothetical protein